MARRQDLQVILETILGSRNVYFQPPATLQMKYPCIVYQRDYAATQFADDGPYLHTKRYQVTIIDADPDSEIPDTIAKLQLCRFASHFVADNLNHDVYSLYF